jgi:hypothetical protein
LNIGRNRGLRACAGVIETERFGGGEDGVVRVDDGGGTEVATVDGLENGGREDENRGGTTEV